jgi:hypothetical protein
MTKRNFKDEGFLAHFSGREFLIQGHGLDNSSGLLVFRALVERGSSDEIIELGNRQGLKLHASFDDSHPGLAMVEAVGLLSHVEHLAKELAALGYERLPDPL